MNNHKGIRRLVVSLILLLGIAGAAHASVTFGDQVKITSNVVFDGYPSVFVDSKDNNYTFFKQSPDSMSETNVTYLYYKKKTPTGKWSKRHLVTKMGIGTYSVIGYESKVYVASGTNNGITLFTISADGSIRKKLITSNQNDIDPSIAKKGNKIYFFWKRRVDEYTDYLGFKTYDLLTNIKTSTKLLDKKVFACKTENLIRVYKDKLHLAWIESGSGSFDNEYTLIRYRTTDFKGNKLKEMRITSTNESDVGDLNFQLNNGEPYFVYEIWDSVIKLARLENGLLKRYEISEESAYAGSAKFLIRDGAMHIAYFNNPVKVIEGPTKPEIVYKKGTIGNFESVQIQGLSIMNTYQDLAMAINSNNKISIAYRQEVRLSNDDWEIIYQKQN